VRKVAKAQQKAFDTEWILEKIVGEDVEHAHIWVFPNKEVSGEPKDFVGNLDKIKNNL
jgi:diadenosine tetraphosphate (Ap4A) HIT family hydrolase